MYRALIEATAFGARKIVETFNRVSPGSISEMMPDYGCFTIAWTSYGIVVPLVQHVFGIHPGFGGTVRAVRRAGVRTAISVGPASAS